MKAKVGDRVRITGATDGKDEAVGLIGTVKLIQSGFYESLIYGVEFQEYIDGHALADENVETHAKEGHGWFFFPDHFVVIPAQLENK